jgi:hypothetical protein
MVEVDPVLRNAQPPEDFALGGEILAFGRAAGVPDEDSRWGRGG